MKKQKLIILLVVLLILTLATGYVIFRTDVNVSSKMAATESLEVIFKNVDSPIEYNSINASARISENRKVLYISVPNLMQKGAYAVFPITIKNIGTLPARLQSITQYGIGSSAIHVSYDGIGIMDGVLYPNEEKEFTVKVLWIRELWGQNNEYDFQINFNYIQA